MRLVTASKLKKLSVNASKTTYMMLGSIFMMLSSIFMM